MEEIPFKAQPQVAQAAHRGAGLNRPGRFESRERVPADDGWESWNDPDLPPLETTVSEDAARTVIARNDSPDIPFDRSLNPYRGCEHGCAYCYARPSHAYFGLSSGLDFETRLFFKPDAAHLLARELRAPSYRVKPIRITSYNVCYTKLLRAPHAVFREPGRTDPRDVGRPAATDRR